MKRFSVCGLALLVLVALVVTTTVRANEDSKKLLNLNLPQISLKKADCCEDDKECCEEKESCCSAGTKILSRAKSLFKKEKCTGKEDCPVCNAKDEDSEESSQVKDVPANVVKKGADKAKETLGRLRQRTEKLIEKIRK